MHPLFPRAALLLALLCAGCHEEAASAPGTADVDLLQPNYVDRGVVIVDPNKQRPNFWDFDLVAYGDRPSHVFRLKNLDPVPVTIRNLAPSCGCLQVVLRSADGKQVIRGVLTEDAPPFRLEPGAEAELELIVDSTRVERMNLDKLAWVRIVCDSKTTPYLSYEAHLKVTRDFLCTPALIDLGEVPQSYGKRVSASVQTDARDSAARILAVASVEGPFLAHVDETEEAGVRTWLLSVDAKEDAPFGYVRGKIVLSTSGSDGQGTGRPFEVPVSALVVPRIVARPAQLRLSLVKDAVACSVECLVPGEKVEIKRVRFEGAGPDFAGEFAALDLDGRRAAKWNVTLRLTEKGAKGGFTRTAVIELDDPKIPELRVPVTVDPN